MYIRNTEIGRVPLLLYVVAMPIRNCDQSTVGTMYTYVPASLRHRPEFRTQSVL